jgi:hypothetical protein
MNRLDHDDNLQMRMRETTNRLSSRFHLVETTTIFIQIIINLTFDFSLNFTLALKTLIDS